MLACARARVASTFGALLPSSWVMATVVRTSALASRLARDSTRASTGRRYRACANTAR